MDNQINVEILRVLRKLLKAERSTKNEPATEWYARAKIALGLAATLLATLIGWYFTWTRDSHERLTKELELIRTVADISELGVDRSAMTMAYLDSLSDEQIYRRVVGSFPGPVREKLLSLSIHRSIAIKDRSALYRAMGVLSPDQIQPNELSQYPLAAAVARADLNVLKWLLDLGFDPATEPSSVSGQTSLMLASSRGAPSLVRLLLTHGANPNRADAHGRTALHRAAEAGHIEIGRQLVRAGADVNARDEEGLSPLLVALKSQTFRESASKMISALLSSGANPNDFEPVYPGARSGTAALRWAVIKSDVESFKTLLEKGESVRDRDDDSHIAFDVVHSGDVQMFNILRDRGLDVKIRNRFGMTLLHVSGRFPEMTKQLLLDGADPNVADADGERPIVSWFDYIPLSGITGEKNEAYLREVEPDLIESLRLAAEKGADVNLPGRYGDTALCKAARYHGVRSIVALLDLKADGTTECSDKETALDLSVERCRAGAIAVLLARHPNLGTAKDELVQTIRDRASFYERHPELAYTQPDCENAEKLLKGEVSAQEIDARIRARLRAIPDLTKELL